MRLFVTLVSTGIVLASAALAQPQPAPQKMDMNAFMARCTQLWQQPGLSQTPQGRQSLDQCDHAAWA